MYWLFYGVFLIVLLQNVQGYFDFTKLECISEDESFGVYDECSLKFHNKTYNYYTVKFKLLQEPVEKVMISYAFFRKMKTWQGFLYNQTVDGCEIVKGNTLNPIQNAAFGILKQYSNLKHPCPFKDSINFENVSNVATSKNFNGIPVPPGDYALQISNLMNDKHKAVLKFYFKVH